MPRSVSFTLLRISPVYFSEIKKPPVWKVFDYGEGEIRTLAAVSHPTPLAGAPLHRLEYFSM